MLPPKLDYLFTVRFKDGTTYRQTPEDQSVVHPLTRSAFYDVAKQLDNVHVFALAHGDRIHAVEFPSGDFITDGQIVPNHRRDLINLRLIYYRQVQQCIVGGEIQKPSIVGYFIGWQGNDETGKNFQKLLEIPPPHVRTDPRFI